MKRAVNGLAICKDNSAIVFQLVGFIQAMTSRGVGNYLRYLNRPKGYWTRQPEVRQRLLEELPRLGLHALYLVCYFIGSLR